MPVLRIATLMAFAVTLWCPLACGLTVESHFEGASVRILEVQNDTQMLRFMPGGDPRRGWPCWWCFRVTGLDTRKALTLELHASDAPMPQANGVPSNKPLSGDWAMADRASFSVDGETWRHTPPGQRSEGCITYTIQPESSTLLLSWGPPYTPSRAAAFVRQMASTHSSAEEKELCLSREGRQVPMLRIREGDRVDGHRYGVWVQARQHAWESGASWVCQGLAEWLLGGEAEAAWLRQHAEVFVVPIMDVDNTATGNGGKEALPHDHNRDWMEKPNWNEVAAAQQHILKLAREKRMDVFLDLHNPAPRDRNAFFYALPQDLIGEPMVSLRSRFVTLATASIRQVFPVLDAPKLDGPKYHPLWRQISGTWVSMNANPTTVALCLETPWNTEHSTTDGYKAVGRQLGKSVQAYLATLPPRS